MNKYKQKKNSTVNIKKKSALTFIQIPI